MSRNIFEDVNIQMDDPKQILLPSVDTPLNFTMAKRTMENHIP